MTWNYRVIKHEDHPDGEPWYAIHETYYDDETGEPTSITEAHIAPIGDTPEELHETLTWMLAAIEKPVLHYIDF